MLKSNVGELAALATAFCWSLSATAFELSGKKVGSLSVNYIRLVTGFIFISVFTFFTRGYFLPIDATSKNWIFLSISGLIGFFIGDLFLFQSYLEVGSRVSMLIMATSPPIAALLGFIIFGEKLRLISILGMAITLLGIAIVILSKNPDEKKIKVTHSVKGLTYAFLGSLGQSVGLIFSKIGMGEYNPFAATQIRIIAGFISFTILFIYLKKWDDLKLALKDKKAMLGITIGSIFGPFVGVSLSLLSLQYTSAGISSTITSIVPVTIIPLSMLVFKEKIKLKEILGAITTVAGVAVLFLF
ncbi:DMT family transporter [Tissierella carlieri]|uniref:DMT family transporter n=1 Tax=Tissierella carlieri TaxID=689904 RepID=A0ABT1S8H6_9FIRM|nr:DMT family transporter [Tissierella carlieri]MCQ4922775.1 DMT family transporter [Tissierella carlieri]MDU5082942.1 DMT family transporter [Bacillota bacterium]